MSVLRSYLLSSAAVWQAPDTPATPDPAGGGDGAPPPAGAEPGAGAAPPPPDPGAGAPPAGAEPPRPGDQRRMIPLDTMMQRISAEQRRVQEANERVQRAEREAADAKALLARLQAAPPAAGQPPASQPAPAAPAAPAADPGRYQADVNAAAAAQRLFEDSLTLKNEGLRQFGAQFNDTLRIMDALGAFEGQKGDEFVSDLLAADKANAHVLLAKIAQDPERAVALVGMPSRMRMVELTKMLDKPAAPPAAAAPAAPGLKPISNAPPPRPPSEPATPPSNDNPLYDDKTDDDAWSRAWDAKHKRRRA